MWMIWPFHEAIKTCKRNISDIQCVFLAQTFIPSNHFQRIHQVKLFPFSASTVCVLA